MAWTTTTTRAYEVDVEVASKKINVIDTPGVYLQNEEEHDDNLKTRDMLLRSRGRVDKVKDPVPAVERIVSRASAQDLMLHYNLPAFTKGDCTTFLSSIARRIGAIKKAGELDLVQAARTVLRDWTTAKLPFYTDAPAPASDAVTEEASLKELYAKADEATLASVRTKKEMRKEGGLVLLAPGETETRKVILDTAFVVEGESDDESEEGYEDHESDEDDEGGSMDEEEDAEGSDDEDELEEDDEEEESEEERLPTPPPTKRKRKDSLPSASTRAPPAKKVAFAAGIQDRNEKRAARQQSKPEPKAKAKPEPKAPKSALKTKSKSAPKPSPAPSKASNKTSAAAAKKASASGNDDAYDFDQFFKG